MNPRLSLPEEALLLGWDDERGKNRWTANLGMVVAGAALMELVLREAAAVTDDGVRAAGQDTGELVLDTVLAEIRASRKPRSVKQWVQHLGNRRQLRDAVLESLLRQGIVRRDERRVLGLLPVRRYPVTQRHRPEEIRQRVRGALTGEDEVEDPRDAALAGLVEPGGSVLLRQLVPKEQRQQARERAKALARGEGVSRDVAKAVSQANAAAMAAISAAAAASASSSSSSS